MNVLNHELYLTSVLYWEITGSCAVVIILEAELNSSGSLVRTPDIAVCWQRGSHISLYIFLANLCNSIVAALFLDDDNFTIELLNAVVLTDNIPRVTLDMLEVGSVIQKFRRRSLDNSS